MNLPFSFQTRSDLDKVLCLMVDKQASDLHAGGDEPLRLRIHGEMQACSKRLLRGHDVEQMLLLAYDENTSAVARVRSGYELDFSYQCLHPYQEALRRFRVNADLRQRFGRKDIKLVFRMINPTPPSIESLALPRSIVDTAMNLAQGMVIVAGATGSGKSTLLASLLHHRLSHRVEHLVTLEAPIEYTYDEIESGSTVTAMEISSILGHANFADALVSTLRKDPDIILVGEARDKATLMAAIAGTQTGHALFTTVHTNGVAETIQRMIKAFDPKERDAMLWDLIDALSMVIYQTLVPCEQGGRVAIREYLIFDEGMKNTLRHQSAEKLTLTMNELLRNHGIPLAKDAQEKLSAGQISVATFENLLRSTDRTLTR